LLTLLWGCAGDSASEMTSPSAGDLSVTTATSTLSLTGRIAFVSNRAGNDDIYVMNANGTGLTRLTDNPANDGQPAWSPDVKRVAFVSSRTGNDEIYVMNADGTSVTRLTKNAAIDRDPAWSPTGTKIAFASNLAVFFFNHPAPTEIYTMN